MQIRIYYEDTDAGGIVYHANYIKYCERARSEVFFERGMSPGDGTKSGFIVKELKANFISTAKVGDIIDVKTKILKIKGSSTLVLQEIFCNDVKLFSMEVLLVFIRGTKPVRMSQEHRELLEEYL